MENSQLLVAHLAPRDRPTIRGIELDSLLFEFFFRSLFPVGGGSLRGSFWLKMASSDPDTSAWGARRPPLIRSPLFDVEDFLGTIRKATTTEDWDLVKAHLTTASRTDGMATEEAREYLDSGEWDSKPFCRTHLLAPDTACRSLIRGTPSLQVQAMIQHGLEFVEGGETQASKRHPLDWGSAEAFDPGLGEQFRSWWLWEGCCQLCTTRITYQQGIFCANFGEDVSGQPVCRKAWCAGCYAAPTNFRFSVFRIKGPDGEDMVPEGEERRYLTARPGDHLMCPFECDFCQFFKLVGRQPNMNLPNDIRRLGFI